MKIKYILLLIIFISSISIPAFSQKIKRVKKSEFKVDESGFKQPWKSLKKGNKRFRQEKKGDYLEALKFYEEAYEYNDDNAELNYLIGISYLQSSEKRNALEYLEKVYMDKEDIVKDLLFWKGRANHYNYKFDEAILDYEEYAGSLEQRKLKKQKAKIDKLIAECESGRELQKDSVRCFIDNLGDGVNSEFPEYSAVFSANGFYLYFTSRREGTTGGKKNGYNKLWYEDVYFSRQVEGVWNKASQLGKPINTKHNDAVVDITPKGKELCIYRGNKGNGDLYNTRKDDSGWGDMNKMKKIDKGKFRESSVSITEDGLILYFISNRDKGVGGQDIWFSYRTQNGEKWQKPENMGSVVNTKYDEETVEISPDGKTLYFSSKGHNTMGGYDVFRTNRNNDGTWTEPVNMGYPINTPDDDVFFMLAPDGHSGYYSSTREGGFGDKDIYSVVFLGPEKPTNTSEGAEEEAIAYFMNPVSEADIEKPVNIKIIQLSLVKGTVTDAYSGKPIEASLELVDNATGKVVKMVNSYASTGAYTVPLPPGKDYALTAGAPDYFFHSENFIISDTSVHEVIRKDIQLQPMGIGAKIVLNNVFFDSGKATLRPESFSELSRLINILRQYTRIVIEISGHTDSRGSLSSNQRLSQKRAQSVVDYILGQGVNLAQIRAVGYGEEQPRADNTTSQGRQLNRRVEAKILEK